MLEPFILFTHPLYYFLSSRRRLVSQRAHAAPYRRQHQLRRPMRPQHTPMAQPQRTSCWWRWCGWRRSGALALSRLSSGGQAGTGSDNGPGSALNAANKWSVCILPFTNGLQECWTMISAHEYTPGDIGSQSPESVSQSAVLTDSRHRQSVPGIDTGTVILELSSTRRHATLNQVCVWGGAGGVEMRLFTLGARSTFFKMPRAFGYAVPND